MPQPKPPFTFVDASKGKGPQVGPSSLGVSGIAGESDFDDPIASAPSPSSVRALAFDPTAPASLCICPLPLTLTPASRPRKGNTEESPGIDVFFSHDGTGCPREEAECLHRCLDAREEWLAAQKPQGSRSRGSGATGLSMDYRAAVCECLMALRNGNRTEDGADNIELLSLTYAIFHLAEIFLLPVYSVPSSATDRGGSSDLGTCFLDESSANDIGRLEGPPGSLTADVVRFLRLHHSPSLMESPNTVSMLNSDQPEYYQPPSSSPYVVPGPYDRPYWNLLLHLTVQGRLAEAWDLLSCCSACRRAEEEVNDAVAAGIHRELSLEGQGFAALKAIFLSAPIPGGRGDRFCDDHGLDDHLEEEALELEDEGGFMGEEVGDDAYDPGDIDEPQIDGVPPKAYLFWEPLPRRADRLRGLRYRRDLRRCGRRDVHAHDTVSLPQVYQPRVALATLRNWQETIRVTAFPKPGARGADSGVLTTLFQRFPPLSHIMSVLLGEEPPMLADLQGLAWGEILSMELLYSRPDIRPEDIATRAEAAMSRSCSWGGRREPLQEIVLGVMNGNAGRAVETMFFLCGGSSGAALPATLTSLLCNLLGHSGHLPLRTDRATPVIQTELLLLAAESIISSFSIQGLQDVGVRAAVRLCLPHAPPRQATREDDIIYEPRVNAMIATALSHRWITQDSEASDLLQLCEECIRLGSIPIADACESLAFSRAQSHILNNDPAKEAYWLLRGIEVNSLWLPHGRRRVLGFASRRRFDHVCGVSANNLVTALARNVGSSVHEHGEDVSSALCSAEALLNGVVMDDTMASVFVGHAEANLLGYVVEIALARMNGDTDRMAEGIVRCLEERQMSDEDGVVATLADPRAYVAFLHLAMAALTEKEVQHDHRPKCSAFSIKTMHVLMARLSEVLSFQGITSSAHVMAPTQPSAEKKLYFTAMQEAFSLGLMRAVAAYRGSSVETKNDKGASINLEEEIELMLGQSI